MSIHSITNEQWEHLTTIGNLHMNIYTGKTEQFELNQYVLQHEKELNHTLIFETLLENIELTPEFVNLNKEYVKAVYRIAKRIEKESESLRSLIRADVFFTLLTKMKVVSE